MKPKYKVTGCARFVVFFIIFIPLVFFGAAYYRGENGMDILKNSYYKVFGHKTTVVDKPNMRPAGGDGTACEAELKTALDKIHQLEDQLRIKEEVIKELKK